MTKEGKKNAEATIQEINLEVVQLKERIKVLEAEGADKDQNIAALQEKVKELWESLIGIKAIMRAFG